MPVFAIGILQGFLLQTVCGCEELTIRIDSMSKALNRLFYPDRVTGTSERTSERPE